MSEIVKRRQPPTVINFGKKERISSGRLNLALVCERLKEEAVNDWYPIGELAKFVYGSPMKANIARIRSATWRFRKELIHQDLFLLHEGRPIERYKIYDERLEVDKQVARMLMRKMHTRSDVSAELYAKAVSIVRAIGPHESNPNLS